MLLVFALIASLPGLDLTTIAQICALTDMQVGCLGPLSYVPIMTHCPAAEHCCYFNLVRPTQSVCMRAVHTCRAAKGLCKPARIMVRGMACNGLG